MALVKRFNHSISYKKQKDLEVGILETARQACGAFPPGEIQCFNEPDLRVNTTSGWLYVEVTELVRPKDQQSHLPVETECFHKEVMRLAEKHHEASGAAPARVFAYFSEERRLKVRDPEGWRRMTADRKAGRLKNKMAHRWLSSSGTTTQRVTTR
jgi:hypothetical protein